jgi:hypothetical protein
MPIEPKIISRSLSHINRQLIFLCCLLSIALSGCMKYETGINFHSLNYGEIIQHIEIGDRLNNFSQQAVQTWIASIEERTKAARGKIERSSDGNLNVIIPFNNPQELVSKLDSYFNANPLPSQEQAGLNTHIQIDQNNFFLVVRNHLTYDIDLRFQIVKSNDPKVSLVSTDALDLNLSIQSPWGVNSNNRPDRIGGDRGANDNQKIWKLRSGQMNHIEATFWLPNPLSIGSIAIALISLAGYYFKYRELPWRKVVVGRG